MLVLSLFCISVLKIYMAACPLKPLTMKFLTICKISWWVIFKVDPVLECHHHHVEVIVMLKLWRNLLPPSS